EIQPFCGVSIIAITYTHPMPPAISGGWNFSANRIGTQRNRKRGDASALRHVTIGAQLAYRPSARCHGGNPLTWTQSDDGRGSQAARKRAHSRGAGPDKSLMSRNISFCRARGQLPVPRRRPPPPRSVACAL